MNSTHARMHRKSVRSKEKRSKSGGQADKQFIVVNGRTPKGHVRVEFYRGRGRNGFGWRVKSANGLSVAVGGEGYTQLRKCVHGFAVLANAILNLKVVFDFRGVGGALQFPSDV